MSNLPPIQVTLTDESLSLLEDIQRRYKALVPDSALFIEDLVAFAIVQVHQELTNLNSMGHYAQAIKTHGGAKALALYRQLYQAEQNGTFNKTVQRLIRDTIKERLQQTLDELRPKSDGFDPRVEEYLARQRDVWFGNHYFSRDEARGMSSIGTPPHPYATGGFVGHAANEADDAPVEMKPPEDAAHYPSDGLQVNVNLRSDQPDSE